MYGDLIRKSNVQNGGAKFFFESTYMNNGNLFCQRRPYWKKATTAIKDDEMRKTLKPGAYR